MTFSIDTTTWRSPNFEPRDAKPDAVVLHTGEGTRKSDLQTLTYKNPVVRKRVSSGYYVCRDGTIYQLVDDVDIAYHAGVSSYLGRSNWNDFSIGIETEHAKGQDWPQLQKDALAWLCRVLIQRHGIKQPMIAAHRWIAPGRKLDPSDWADISLRAWISGLYVTPAATKGLTFQHEPRITKDVFKRVLTDRKSPCAPVADECYSIILNNSLDPACLLGLFAHESEYGTTGVAVTTFNWGNVRAPFKASRAVGTHPRNFAVYPDWQTGLQDLCERLNVRYIQERGATTLEAIIPIYAPVADGNVPMAYINHVLSLVAQWEKESAMQEKDYPAAWGPNAPYNADWGIATAWRKELDEGRDPGAILGPEQYVNGVAVQIAQHTAFLHKDGITRVVRL